MISALNTIPLGRGAAKQARAAWGARSPAARSPPPGRERVAPSSVVLSVVSSDASANIVQCAVSSSAEYHKGSVWRRWLSM